MPSTRSVLTVALVCVLAAGCGMMARMPAPDGLGYGRPDPNPAAYTFADTTAFSIRTGMGPMTVTTTRAGTAELDFRRWDDGFRVQVRFPALRGTFRNPAQGETVVDASHIGGPFTVLVDHRGFEAVTDTPSLSEALLDIAGPENLVRSLFVRLPGGPVGSGAVWMDTVTILEEVGGTRSEARSVITSTLEGDTVVAGRRLLRIATSAETSIAVTGVSGGVEIEQRLAGTVTGVVLWDDRARLLVERHEAGRLEGTLRLVDVAADAMPVEADVRRAVSLRE